MQIHRRPGTSDHPYRDPLPPISKLVFYGTSLLLSLQDDRASDGITTSANLYATVRPFTLLLQERLVI
jgi:hypothetical protein